MSKAILTLTLCAAAVAGDAGRDARGGRKDLSALGFSLSYDPALYSSCRATRLPRFTQQENGSDIPLDVGPARVNFAFKAVPAATLREHADPAFALDGHLTVIPLQDPSVPDYDQSYPAVRPNVQDLRRLLAERPKTAPVQSSLPDLNPVEAAQSLHAQLAYLDTPWCSGVFFLTRYEQDSGAITGDELSAVFQGLSKDGRYYITADLPVGHRALLKLPAPDDQEIEAHYEAYLRRIEATLNGAKEDTFSPSLAKLKAMIQSLHPQP